MDTNSFPTTASAQSPGPTAPPVVSVIILNYNGLQWINRCLESLKTQTIFSKIEVIVADNRSSDGSDKAFENALAGWTNGSFIQNGANYGFCEGNNRPAKKARGKYLFFLNNDAWLEPDCLEILLRETENAQAQAAGPLMLNYDDNTVQTPGGAGFDLFGLISDCRDWSRTQQLFVVSGCCYLIQRDLFDRLGGFDPEFFMYADEYDLSWRVWVAGGTALLVPAAHMHHRSGANINPKGGAQIVEIRTSDMKRFYANRNSLLVLLKNCHNLLLLLVPLQLALLAAEAAVSIPLFRRWTFTKTAYWNPIKDCWRLRHHIMAERRKLGHLRKRSDLWLLRFLRLRLNRTNELRQILRLGVPKVTTL